MKLLKVTQPIGEFYMSVIPANILINKTTINRRNEEGGIQRELSLGRMKEICNYIREKDATFPTSIIIAATSEVKKELIENEGIFSLDIERIDCIGEIIDGQHRVQAFREVKDSTIDKFELPVVLMFDLEEEGKAYVFSTINSKQAKINPSLIFDLFSLSSNRSPQKTCHEIARLANKDKYSPFFERLKMLGKKEKGTETLSQGTFVKQLLTLLSRNPDEDLSKSKKNEKLSKDEKLPFRSLFIDEKDEVIYKILMNMFKAIKILFPDEWANGIWTKTVGYGALIKSLKEIYFIGLEEKDLSEDFFRKGFMGLSIDVDYTSGEKAEMELKNKIVKQFKKNYE